MTLFEEHMQYAQKVIAVRDALIRSILRPAAFKTIRDLHYDGDAKSRLKISYSDMRLELMSIHIGPKLMGSNITHGSIGHGSITFNDGISTVYDHFIGGNQDNEVYIKALYDEDIHFQHSLLYSNEQLLGHLIYNAMYNNKICSPYLHCDMIIHPKWINMLYEDIDFDII